MFFSSKPLSVDFTASDISYYASNLKNADLLAHSSYEELVEQINLLIDTLNEIIETGTENLNTCREQLALCEEEMRVAKAKEAVLDRILRETTNHLNALNSSVSAAQANVSSASSSLASIRSRTANTEAERAARRSAVAAAERHVSACKAQYEKLRAKQQKLAKAKEGLDPQFVALRKAYSELSFVKTDLQRQENTIEQSLNEAIRFGDRLHDSQKALYSALSRHIEGTLRTCHTATNTALSRARYALNCMASLNDKNYSEFERIRMTNVANVRDRAEKMHSDLSHAADRFRAFHQTQARYEYILKDNIMLKSHDRIDALLDEQRGTIEQLKAKASRLFEFCTALIEYGKVRP